MWENGNLEEAGGTCGSASKLRWKAVVAVEDECMDVEKTWNNWNDGVTHAAVSVMDTSAEDV